jgi:hypothetical protein
MTTSPQNLTTYWTRTRMQIYAGDDTIVHSFLAKFLYIR